MDKESNYYGNYALNFLKGQIYNIEICWDQVKIWYEYKQYNMFHNYVYKKGLTKVLLLLPSPSSYILL
jgi:hypothetical protein